MRTDLAASAVPAVAVPEAGADKANFFGLRAGNADGWIQRHGFSAADRERSSSGARRLTVKDCPPRLARVMVAVSTAQVQMSEVQSPPG